MDTTTEIEIQRSVSRSCSIVRILTLILAFASLIVLSVALVVVGILGTLNLSVSREGLLANL